MFKRKHANHILAVFVGCTGILHSENAEAVCTSPAPIPPPSPIQTFTACAGPGNSFDPLPTNDGVTLAIGDLGDPDTGFDLGGGADFMLMSGSVAGNGATLSGGSSFDALFLTAADASDLILSNWEFGAATVGSELSLSAGTHVTQFLIVDATSDLVIKQGTTAINGTISAGGFTSPSVVTHFGTLDMADGAPDDRLVIGVFTQDTVDFKMDFSLADETSDTVSVSLVTAPTGTNEIEHTFTTLPVFNQVVGGPIGIVTVDGQENPLNDLSGIVSDTLSTLAGLPDFLSDVELPDFDLPVDLPDLVEPETRPDPLTPATDPFDVVQHDDYIFDNDPSDEERFFFLEPGSADGVYLSWMPNPSLPAEDLISLMGGTLKGLQGVNDRIGQSFFDEGPRVEVGADLYLWARVSAIHNRKQGFGFDPVRKADNALSRTSALTGNVTGETSYFIGGVERDFFLNGTLAGEGPEFTLGVHGGYVNSNYDADNPLADVGLGGSSNARSNTALGGAYARGQAGWFYAGSTVSGFLGETGTYMANTTFEDQAEFQTKGFAAQGALGMRIPLHSMVSFDMRGLLSYGRLDAQNHVTDIGFDVQNTFSEYYRGGGSIGLLAAHVDDGGNRFQGFLRLGLEEELIDIADTTVNTVEFDGRHPEDTLLTATLGLEYETVGGGKLRFAADYARDPSKAFDDEGSFGAQFGFVIPLQ